MLKCVDQGLCAGCVVVTRQKRSAVSFDCSESIESNEHIGGLPTDRYTSPPPRHQNIVVKSPTQQKHLKLYTEQPPKPVRPPIEAVGCLAELLQSFETATGCPLRYVPVANSKDKEWNAATWSAPVCDRPKHPAGFLVLMPSKKGVRGERSAEREERKTTAPGGKHGHTPKASEKLAGSIADLLGDLLQTRYALRHREAELAAGVPVVPRPEEPKHLAERLEEVLRAGAEAVGCHAAAAYLLDEGTTSLKLRCSWGLPFERLTAPARPLKGAIADLEALLGHAVVLDNPEIMHTWNVPENYPTAVCVPIATATTLLGTLWVFCDEHRDFNDRETNILEVVAGRLASDFEREMLVRAGVDGANLQKQVAAAERLQRNELPTIAPLLDGWDVAGQTMQTEGVGSAFHDWFSLPKGLLAVAVGRADERGIAGALTANAVKTALRSHARYHHLAERILRQVNLTLWTGSAGDRRVALFHGLIETATGRVNCAVAGRPSVVLLRGDGWQSLSRNAVRLGESPEADFEQFDQELQPGEAILVFTGGVAGGEGGALEETLLGDALRGKLDLSAGELVAAARAALDAKDGEAAGGVSPLLPGGIPDRSILVVKRTPA